MTDVAAVEDPDNDLVAVREELQDAARALVRDVERLDDGEFTQVCGGAAAGAAVEELREAVHDDDAEWVVAAAVALVRLMRSLCSCVLDGDGPATAATFLGAVARMSGLAAQLANAEAVAGIEDAPGSFGLASSISPLLQSAGPPSPPEPDSFGERAVMPLRLLAGTTVSHETAVKLTGLPTEPADAVLKGQTRAGQLTVRYLAPTATGAPLPDHPDIERDSLDRLLAAYLPAVTDARHVIEHHRVHGHHLPPACTEAARKHAWLCGELEALALLQRCAARHGLHEQSLQVALAACQTYDRSAARTAILRRGTTSAEVVKNPSAHAQLLRSLADAYLKAGDLTSAARYADKARAIEEQTGRDPHAHAETLTLLGRIALADNHQADPRDLFTQAHGLYIRLGDLQCAAFTTRCLGQAALATDDLHEARLLLEAVHAYFSATEPARDLVGLGPTQLLLAHIDMREHRHDAAERGLMSVLQIAACLADDHLEAAAYVAMGDLAAAKGQPQLERDHRQHVSELRIGLGIPDTATYIWGPPG